MAIVKNDLFDYTNRYIYQDSDCFKFSLDSILLAEYVHVKNNNELICDMCAGNMAIPLIISKYTESKIIGFEIQEKIYKLGLESIKLNNLENNLKIINENVNNLGDFYKAETFDIMVCNPPFFKVNESSYLNEKEELQIARHEIKLTLENIFELSFKFLKNKGELYMVHRAERLDEIITLGYKYHTYIKEVVPVCTKENTDPYMVLIKAVKNSKPGIKIKQNICVENLTSYQHLFK